MLGFRVQRVQGLGYRWLKILPRIETTVNNCIQLLLNLRRTSAQTKRCHCIPFSRIVKPSNCNIRAEADIPRRRLLRWEDCRV